MHRELLGTYLLVGGGTVAGLVAAILLVESGPGLLWLFGAGAGTMIGAFVAAIASNEPLVGGGSRYEPVFPPPPPRPSPSAPGLRGMGRHSASNGHRSTSGPGGGNGDASYRGSEDLAERQRDTSSRGGPRSS